MTKIKLCGLSRLSDVEAVNELMPEYVGFIFVPGRRRYIPPKQAAKLKDRLLPKIQAVGVFIDDSPEHVAELLEQKIIDLAQLHGSEDENYIRRLRLLTDRPIIKAFRIDTAEDVRRAASSPADYVLLDSGIGGTGKVFDWKLIGQKEDSPEKPEQDDELPAGWWQGQLSRPYFLAGGLNVENVRAAVEAFHPYAVDVSSGIETDGMKDREKMRAFVRQVRSAG